MSGLKIFVCKHILDESFGNTVSKIGAFLLANSPCNLRTVISDTKVPSEQVKKSLCALLQHNIASFNSTKRGVKEYSVRSEDVLIRLKFPRFIYYIKTIYGDIAEILIEELLGCGQTQMSFLIDKVKERLNSSLPEVNNVSLSQVKEKFIYLVKTHFVQRCVAAKPQDKDDEDPLKDLYTIPNIDLELLARRKRRRESEGVADQPAAKRAKLSTDALPDEHIYWRVNYERFEIYLRDQQLVRAITSKIDRNAGEVVRTVLRLSEAVSDPAACVTNPISATEIYNTIPKEICTVRPQLDQYLSILAEDRTDFVKKVEESGGGMFRVDFKKAYKSLATAHIESVVQERFGSKCLRIFRLLLLKKHLEQKQIEESAMIPAKECKEMLYTMFGQNFIHLTEIPKTPDHAPARTFYLFSVDIDQISRMLLETCYKTLANLMVRREYETKENRRLLEKEQRVAAILASLVQQGADDAQKAEVEEMITPSEQKQLTRVKHVTEKLEQAELQLDETISVLEKFIHYEKMS